MGFIDSTIGVVEIGSLVSMFLFGVITLQTLVYFKKFPNDGMGLKVMVSVLWIFQFAHTILISVAVYQMTISFIGPPSSLRFTIFQIATLPSAVILFIIETFLIVRLWRLLRQPILTVVCSVLALLGFVNMIIITAFSIKEPNTFKQKYEWLVELNIGTGMSLDALLCASLSWYLFRNRRETISKDTVRVLDKLIFWTIQTGLSTLLTAIVMTLFYKSKPETMIWDAIGMAFPKVFSIQLLGTLNSRALSQNLVVTEPQVGFVRSRITRTATEALTTEFKSEFKVKSRTAQLSLEQEQDVWFSSPPDQLDLKALP